MANRALSPTAWPKVAYLLSSIRLAEQFVGLSQQELRIGGKEDSMRTKPHATAERPRTDWARVDALTDEEIEAAVQDDPDAAPIADAAWFADATWVMPKPKEQISIRLDADVLAHFRKYPRYQTRINAILRAAMEHEKKQAG
jgi:uncharacterized protein (DUF4415 family)